MIKENISIEEQAKNIIDFLGTEIAKTHPDRMIEGCEERITFFNKQIEGLKINIKEEQDIIKRMGEVKKIILNKHQQTTTN